MTLKILSAVIDYAILFCICGFVYKIMHAMYHSLYKAAYADDKLKTTGKKAALVILQSYDQKLVGKRILFSDTLTLGRGTDNNIVMADAYVSHHHAVISSVKNQYQIEDLHSRNYTYVNDRELTNKIFLQNEDIIKIGTTVFKFER